MRVMKLLALSISYNRYAINAFSIRRHHLLSRPSAYTSNISSSTALNKYRKVKWTPQSGAYVSLPHFNPHKGLDNNGPTSYAPHDNYGVTTSFSTIAESLEQISSDLKGLDDGAIQMDLQVADTLSNHVIEAVKRNNFAPIVVTVVDIQANILVQKKMDGCVGPAFPEFSYAKAYTCVALNVSSREFRDKYTKENDPGKIAQLNSFMAISGKFAAFPGGILLRNGDGQVVGAIGVSGAAGDEDEYGALKGVWDSGLAISTWPEEHSCATALD